MAFKRWYDFDPRLSTVVRSMEFMNTPSQLRFAEKLLELSEELLLEQGGQAYIEELDTRKKDGLDKAQAKNRWYDQYEVLHQAFNNLYALTNTDRISIAARLVTPIEIVAGYEQHCKTLHKEPDLKIIEEVMRSCLQDGSDRARKLYAVYLNDYSAYTKPKSATPPPPKGLWEGLFESIQKALTPA